MMLMHMADANNDGAVTRAEFDAARAKHFDMVDTNKDGSISAAEREAAHAAMRGKMHERMGGPGAPPPPPAN